MLLGSQIENWPSTWHMEVARNLDKTSVSGRKVQKAAWRQLKREGKGWNQRSRDDALGFCYKGKGKNG